MQTGHRSAPPPDLRIIRTESALAHETHDSQRSLPLIEALRKAEVIINPPIVAPIDEEHYVILDGANRCYSFQHLEYPHILVQVAAYDSGLVELDTWQHVVSGWGIGAFIEGLKQIDGIHLKEGLDETAITSFFTRDGAKWSVMAKGAPDLARRNLLLRGVVRVYQSNARLYRSAISQPESVWPLFPEAIALMFFPQYKPEDIIAAAREHAFLPPGISRHIIHGRALRVNYPLAPLRDPYTDLQHKNEALQQWIHQKLAQRQIRYYAEAIYQFDE